MLLSQVKSLVEGIRLEIASIHEQIRAARNAAEASRKAHEEIPVRLAELRIPADERAKADAYREKAHRQQVWLTWGTWLAFITAAIYAAIAASQLKQMRIATEAAKRASDIAADALEFSNGNFDRTMHLMANQTAAQFESAQTAKNAVGITREQMRLDERAWLVVISSSVDPFEEGKPTKFSIQGKNTGKTPARKSVFTKYLTAAKVEVTSEGELMKTAPLHPPSSVGLIGPDATAEADDVLPAEYSSIFKQRIGESGFVYLWGNITYRDIFDRKHETLFCEYRQASSPIKEFIQCKFHNEAN